MTTYEKYQKLKDYLLELGSVAVAFSSGVDSTFLLKAAVESDCSYSFLLFFSGQRIKGSRRVL